MPFSTVSSLAALRSVSGMRLVSGRLAAHQALAYVGGACGPAQQVRVAHGNRPRYAMRNTVFHPTTACAFRCVWCCHFGSKTCPQDTASTGERTVQQLVDARAFSRTCISSRTIRRTAELQPSTNPAPRVFPSPNRTHPHPPHRTPPQRPLALRRPCSSNARTKPFTDKAAMLFRFLLRQGISHTRQNKSEKHRGHVHIFARFASSLAGLREPTRTAVPQGGHRGSLDR